MVSQRGQDSARTCHLQSPAEYQLVFIEPVNCNLPLCPLHSTPAGSPPNSPEREDAGLSTIPVVDSEESFELSLVSPEQTDQSVPVVMAAAAQDPLALLQALLQNEDRPNARESLHGIINDWQNLLDRMDNYTVEDVRSSHDSEECMELISGIRRDLETMQARMNRAATEMPQLMDDDVSGGERLLNINLNIVSEKS